MIYCMITVLSCTKNTFHFSLLLYSAVSMEVQDLLYMEGEKKKNCINIASNVKKCDRKSKKIKK